MIFFLPTDLKPVAVAADASSMPIVDLGFAKLFGYLAFAGVVAGVLRLF